MSLSTWLYKAFIPLQGRKKKKKKNNRKLMSHSQE